MSSIACPFCGTVLDSPLKLCLSCGRGITQEDLQHAGLKLNKAGANGVSGKFALAKKDHTMHRQMRSMLWTTTAVMVLVLGYWCTMRYVLHEHLPFKVDVMIEQMIQGGGTAAPTADATAGSTVDTTTTEAVNTAR